ncbi:MAG: amidohydrolase family protein [Sphingomonadales bacterium]|nr:amidohydrolase family protein [Sphingomonadales bacterium]
MAFPKAQPVIDLMINIPTDAHNQAGYKAVAAMQRETADQATAMPAGYMFREVPTLGDDPAQYVAKIIEQMDRFNVAKAMVTVAEAERHPEIRTTYRDRFFLQASINPNHGMDEVRRIRRLKDEWDIKAVSYFPAASLPQVALHERELYPIYAACIDLDIPFVANVGVPGPRMLLRTQKVEWLDEVCWFFPELKFVMRHCGEPWEDLAVKLMLKYPNLYYSTSAFAPKYYPKAIIDYANSRGAGKIMYAGYFPAGLTLERIFAELEQVPFDDAVWPGFLHDNAARVFKLD